MKTLADIRARNECREMGLYDYECMTPCKKCDKPGWRRVADDVCLMCHGPTQRKLARELRDNQLQQAAQARARARELKNRMYWSSVPCKECGKQGDRYVVLNLCARCNPPR